MTRNGLWLIWGLALAVAVACSGPDSDEAPERVPAGFPSVDGWSAAGEVRSFDAGTLYEEINGAADVYLSYGFEELRVRELSSGSRTVAVSLYEMSSPLSAFGIYRTEAPADGEVLDIGTEARLALPYQAMLLKDRCYIKVDAVKGELTEGAARELLGGLASALPGEDGLPSALAALPDDGMVPDTTAYTREGFLGLSEMTDCVHATYSSGGDESEFVGFVMLPPGSDDGGGWERLGELEPWRSATLGPTTALIRDVPYTGVVAVVQGEEGRLLGVAGGADIGETTAHLEQLGFLSP